MTMLDGVEERAPVRDWRLAARVTAAVAPFATCAVLAAIRGTVSDAVAILVLVLWVVAGAATGDRVAGLLAAVSGGVWFDFFLTQPYLRLSIADPDDVETVILLVLIGAAVVRDRVVGTPAGGRRRSPLRLPGRRARRSPDGGCGGHLDPRDARPRRPADRRCPRGGVLPVRPRPGA